MRQDGGQVKILLYKWEAGSESSFACSNLNSDTPLVTNLSFIYLFFFSPFRLFFTYFHPSVSRAGVLGTLCRSRNNPPLCFRSAQCIHSVSKSHRIALYRTQRYRHVDCRNLRFKQSTTSVCKPEGLRGGVQLNCIRYRLQTPSFILNCRI